MEQQPAELVDQQVAARIRARRIEQGITLQALARQIGVAFQQAHKYERGLSRISAGRLYHVARALSVPVEFFFAGGPSREEAGGAAAPTHRAGDVA
jgi:transcriptional regulator with XRE-family HTH domain